MQTLLFAGQKEEFGNHTKTNTVMLYPYLQIKLEWRWPGRNKHGKDRGAGGTKGSGKLWYIGVFTTHHIGTWCTCHSCLMLCCALLTAVPDSHCYSLLFSPSALQFYHHYVCRQSSLPSAGSDLSLPEGNLEWAGDHLELPGDRVELRQKSSAYASANYNNTDNRWDMLTFLLRC
jgi:hypothetical protein